MLETFWMHILHIINNFSYFYIQYLLYHLLFSLVLPQASAIAHNQLVTTYQGGGHSAHQHPPLPNQTTTVTSRPYSPPNKTPSKVSVAPFRVTARQWRMSPLTSSPLTSSRLLSSSSLPLPPPPPSYIDKMLPEGSSSPPSSLLLSFYLSIVDSPSSFLVFLGGNNCYVVFLRRSRRVGRRGEPL